jgi:hypothetical protein
MAAKVEVSGVGAGIGKKLAYTAVAVAVLLLLAEADRRDITYLNVANLGDNSFETRGQIARFVAFGGRPRLVVIYTGDNEWNGFRYPRLSLPSVSRLDTLMLWSKAYTSLRTAARVAIQASV